MNSKPFSLLFWVYFFTTTLSQLCTIENCAECSGAQCKNCMDGFFLTDFNQCKPCPGQCSKCKPNQTGYPICTQCITGSQLTKQNRCIPCRSPCQTCQQQFPQNCTSCFQGYTFQEQNFKCVQKTNCSVVPGCKQCNTEVVNKTSCTQCQKGLFVFSNGCTKCPQPCLDCELNLQTIWPQVRKYWNQIGVKIQQLKKEQEQVLNGRLLEQVQLNQAQADQAPTINSQDFNQVNEMEQDQNQLEGGQQSKIGQNKSQIIQNQVRTNKSETVNDNEVANISIQSKLDDDKVILTDNKIKNITQQIVEQSNQTQKQRTDGANIGQQQSIKYINNRSIEVQQNYSTGKQGASDLQQLQQKQTVRDYIGDQLKNQSNYPVINKGNYSQQQLENQTHWTLEEWKYLTDLAKQQRSFSEVDFLLIKSLTQGYFFFTALSKFLPQQNFMVIAIHTLPIIEEMYTLQFDINKQQQFFSKHIVLMSPDSRNFSLFRYQLNRLVTQKSKCKLCKQGYFLNSLEKCQRCSLNCIFCSNPTNCQVCAPGFYLTNQKNCQKCNQSCGGCSVNPNNCTSCQAPYILSGFSCILTLCDHSCKVCSPQNNRKCITCFEQYSLLPNKQGKCFQCNNQGCIKCTQNDRDRCQLCAPGYALTSKRFQCKPCPDNCQQCLFLNQTLRCYRCHSDYALVDDKCLKCEASCAQCYPTNPKMCYKCEKWQFMDIETSTCKNCPIGCLSCNSSNTCTKFMSGYTLIKQNIFKCSIGCLKCDQIRPEICYNCQKGFFLDKEGGCKQCRVRCIECLDSQICKNCILGSILVNNTCLKCPPNCITCQQQNPNVCLTCLSGFTVKENQCVENLCANGCGLCRFGQPDACIRCERGYTLAPNLRCLKCVGNCSGTCDPHNVSYCVSCSQGEELRNNVCVSCPNKCAVCLRGKCQRCVEGYNLNTQLNICEQQCLFPCTECQGRICLVCENGYEMKDNKCVVKLDCDDKQQSQKECWNCLPGSWFQESLQQCLKCPVNCAECQSNDKGCEVCFDGYYLDENKECSACSAGCLTCYDAFNCKTCTEGFVKEVWEVVLSAARTANEPKCVPCSLNCVTCEIYADRCTSCKPGTRLYRDICIFNYTIIYQFQFDTEYETFIGSYEPQNFRQVLVKLLKVLNQELIIDFIGQGSTIIKGLILTDSQLRARNIKTKLFSLSTQGGKIGQNKIISFNCQIYDKQAIIMTQEKKQIKDQMQEAIQKYFSPITIIITSFSIMVTLLIILIVVKCRKYLIMKKQIPFRKFDDQYALPPGTEQYALKQGRKSASSTQKHIKSSEIL